VTVLFAVPLPEDTRPRLCTRLWCGFSRRRWCIRSGPRASRKCAVGSWWSTRH